MLSLLFVGLLVLLFVPVVVKIIKIITFSLINFGHSPVNFDRSAIVRRILVLKMHKGRLKVNNKHVVGGGGGRWGWSQ